MLARSTLACALAAATWTPNARAGDSPLRTAGVVVAPGGLVSHAGERLGTLSLPPAPRRLSVSRPTVSGHRLLHVVVTTAPEAGTRPDGDAIRPRAELLVDPGATGKERVIFVGTTGPQGVDAEWSQHLRVTGRQVLVYQRREGIDRCDGAPVHLFPQLYDFAQHRFRPAASVQRPERAQELTATRRPTHPVPAADPLALFRLVAASTQAGDERSAINLGPPAEAEDGDPATVWAETLGTDGRGEFLTARAVESPYRLTAVRIIPGDATDRTRFARANRLKSALLALSPTLQYRIRFPRDPLVDRGRFDQPYWVVLPQPTITTCATLVIEAVYPGTEARSSASGQGRTAIAELRFYTELDAMAGGAIPQVMRDLASADPTRHRSAAVVLGRLRDAGIDQMLAALPSARPPLLGRIVRVLGRHPVARTAAPLALALPRMRPETRQAAVEILARIGLPAVPAAAPLLQTGTSAVQVSVAELLGQIGGTGALEALLAAAGHGDVELRRAVVSGLTRLTRPPDALDSVLRAAVATGGRGLRCADLVLAVGHLGQRRGGHQARSAAAALSALWKRLVVARAQPRSMPASAPTDPAPAAPDTDTDSAFEVRYRVIRAVGRLDASGQLETLASAAVDPAAVLRWMAVEQIQRVPGKQGTELLVRALGDRDPRVRATAANALAHRRGPTVASGLARSLDRERWDFAGRAIAEALGRHCTPAAVVALDRAIARDRGGVDERALISLVECRPPRIVDRLLSLAGDRRQRTALRQRAIAVVPTPLSSEQLARLLALFTDLRRGGLRDDAAEVVAASCTATLARSGGPAATRALSDALALDPSPMIRAAAARALGESCAPDARATLRRAASDGEAMVSQAARTALQRCRW